MTSNSRTKNFIKNATIGISSQIVSYILSFVGRTFFIHYLGAEYLGINGLYTSVLFLLSLAELGIGNVLTFVLYKPVSEGNQEKIVELLHYFKKIYRIIAFTILGIGLALIPFLGFFVKSDLPRNDLILYYVLFLLNSVVSYFVIYKTTLINADQRIYITKIADSVTNVLLTGIQIVIIMLTKSYVLYLCAIIVSSVLKNICLSQIANKNYPYIKTVKVKTIDTGEKKAINDRIKSMFLYKAATVIINQSTNIIISAMLGTAIVGYYSNYTMIMSLVNGFISILITSVFASLGHLNTGEEKEKSYQIFNGLILFFHWLGAVCSICFLLIYNDFILLWIGQQYVLDVATVVAVVINFYLVTISNQNWMYRETMGLFSDIKYVMFYAAIINIACAIILGNLIGLPGILLATSIGRCATIFWYEPQILYRKQFKKPVTKYWIKQGINSIITFVSLGISFVICRNFSASFSMIALKIAIVTIITTSCFIVFHLRSRDLHLLLSYVSTLNFVKIIRR